MVVLKGIVGTCTATVVKGGLNLALAAAGARAAVLEPVEDVGITNGAKFLKQLPYSDGFVFGWVNHATVEDGLENKDLFWFGSPS